MLAPVGSRDQVRECAQGSRVEKVTAFARTGFDAKHGWVNLRAPDRPRRGRRQPWRLEGMQAPPLGGFVGTSVTGATCRREDSGGGSPVVPVPPEPFPGDDRTVGFEQRLVRRRILPVRQVSLARGHAATTADKGRLTHSPGWGNCLVEADQGVTQAAGGELGAAGHIIGGAGALHILAGGFVADAEDGRNLPVGLAGSNQANALPLPPAQPRAGTGAPSNAGSGRTCAIVAWPDP